MNEGNLPRYHEKLTKESGNINNFLFFQIVTFYKFTQPQISEEELKPLRDLIYNKLQELEIKGTILIAKEGINGTISSKNDAQQSHRLQEAYDFIQTQPQLGKITNGKYSTAKFNPFKKLKIKVRPEIVTFGLGEIDVVNNTGKHVNAQEWNQLLNDPEVLVIDTRNDFEYKMGTFKNAVNPNTKTFRELPEFVAATMKNTQHKKVAMCCTGGVRCEKSTAYLKDLGFEEVYQLEGGILNYFEEIDPKESLWQGRCFIFDDRIAVDQNLTPVGVPEDHINYGRRAMIGKDGEY